MTGLLKKLVICAGVIVLLGGCAWSEADSNLKHARALRVGMTKGEVLKIMGPPQSDEVYALPDLWFYYTNPNWIDGLVTEDECMPLVFRDGKLVGWGNEYYTASRIKRADGKDDKRVNLETKLK